MISQSKMDLQRERENTNEARRCGNCRLYDPPADEPGMHHTDGACLFRLSETLPFWAYEFAINAVEPDDGAFCNAWDART